MLYSYWLINAKYKEEMVLKKQMKRVFSLLLVAVMLLSMAACTPTDPTGSTAGSTGDPTGTTAPVIKDEYFLPKEEGCNQLTIYWDYAGDVSTAGFWIWPNEGAGKSYGTYECSYGVKCMVNIPKDVTRVGLWRCHLRRRQLARWHQGL